MQVEDFTEAVDEQFERFKLALEQRKVKIHEQQLRNIRLDYL